MRSMSVMSLCVLACVWLSACGSHRVLTTDVRAGGVTYTFETGHYQAKVGEGGDVDFRGFRNEISVDAGVVTRGDEVVATVQPGDRVHLTNQGLVAVDRVQPIE